MSGGDGKDSRGPSAGVKGGSKGHRANVGDGGSMNTNIPGMGDVHIDGAHGLNPGKDSGIHWGGGNGNGNNGGDTSGSKDKGGKQLNGLPGHPNVADGGQLYGDNANKHQYYSRVGKNTYSVIVDGNGEVKGTFFESGQESGNTSARNTDKDNAAKQVWAYVNEKKKAKEKADADAKAKAKAKADLAAEAKRKADAEKAEAQRRADEEAKRKQAEWDAKNKEEAAQRQINEAQQRINQSQQDKNNADQRSGQHDSAANNIQNEQNALRQEQQSAYADFERLVASGAMNQVGSPPFNLARSLQNKSNVAKANADAKQGDIDRERNAANQARNEANQAQQRVEQAQREKAEAENRLNNLRAERQAREAAEAKRKADEKAAKAAAEAKRKADEARKAAEAKAKADAEAKRKADEEAKKKEEEAVKDAVKFTADFYKEVFKVYGEKAEQLAKGLANQAKGKKVRNVEDALKSYDKYKANINKKINAKDREAIAKALESVDVGKAAKNIAKFSKGLGYVGKAIDRYELLFVELPKAVRTGNWRPFFVKVETIGAGMAASALTAFTFAVLLGNPVGLLGYALIMAAVGALITDDLVDEANKLIGI